MTIHVVAAVVLVIGVVALGLAACGGSISSSAAPAKMTMPQWWSNCGSAEIQGINLDLANVQGAVNSGQNPGDNVGQLGADAQSALSQEPLPPAGTADFTGWLDSLVQIANSIRDGVPAITAFQTMDAADGSAHLRAFQGVIQSYGLELPAAS